MTAPGGSGGGGTGTGSAALPTNVSPQGIKGFPEFQLGGNAADWREAAALYRAVGEQLEDARGQLDGAMAALDKDWQGWAAQQFHRCAQALASVAYEAADACSVIAPAINAYAGAVETAVDGYVAARTAYRNAVSNANQAADDLNAANKKINSGGAPPSVHHDATTATGTLSDQESAANQAVARAQAVISDWSSAASKLDYVLNGQGVPGGITFGAPSGPADAAWTLNHQEVVNSIPPGLAAWFKTLDGTFGVWGNDADSHIPGYRLWYDDDHEALQSAVGDLFTFFLTLADGIGLIKDVAEGSIDQLAKDLGIKVVKGESEDDIRDAVADKLDELLANSATRAETLTTIFTAAAKGGGEALLHNDLVQSQAVAELNNIAANAGIPIPPAVETAIQDIYGAHDVKSASELLNKFADDLKDQVSDDVKDKVEDLVKTILNANT